MTARNRMPRLFLLEYTVVREEWSVRTMSNHLHYSFSLSLSLLLFWFFSSCSLSLLSCSTTTVYYQQKNDEEKRERDHAISSSRWRMSCLFSNSDEKWAELCDYSSNEHHFACSHTLAVGGSPEENKCTCEDYRRSGVLARTEQKMLIGWETARVVARGTLIRTDVWVSRRCSQTNNVQV